MSVKIRLQRFGRKKYAYYHIVVADSRAPRDGKFIERLGNYNPNVNPAAIEINVDKAAKWLENGAQPTDTCRAILSYKGVLYRHHLNTGIRKGALTQEQADEKFAAWLSEKEAKVEGKKNLLADASLSENKERLAREAKKNEERAKRIAAKNVVAEEVAEEAPEAVAEEAAPVAESSDEAAADVAVEETPAATAENEETTSAE
jgi:small subunit ribosomal protein S16